MNEIILGMFSGVQIAVFAALLFYVYITQKASERDWRPLYVLAAAFFFIAVLEFYHVMALAETGLIFSFLADFETVNLLTELLYLIAGVALFFQHRAFLAENDN